MKNDAPIDEKEQEQETPKSLLEELIREGARRLRQAAIEQEEYSMSPMLSVCSICPILLERYFRDINWRQSWWDISDRR